VFLIFYAFDFVPKFSCHFLRTKAGTAEVRLSHRNSVCLFICPFICHTGGSVKNGAS